MMIYEMLSEDVPLDGEKRLSTRSLEKDGSMESLLGKLK